MLKRIYIDNYRCFGNFDYHPRERQLIIGRNGTGKSTLFEVLRNLRDFSARGLPADDLFSRETLTRWQNVSEQVFRLELDGNDGVYKYELVLDRIGSNERPRVRKERVEFDGKSVFGFDDGTVHLFNDQHADKVQFGSDWHRSALAAIAERPENTKLTWFKKWLDRVLCVQVDPKRMSARAEKEADFPAPDMANFASWYRHLLQERSGEMADLRNVLREVVDGFDSLDAKEAGQNVRILRANLHAEAGDKEPKPKKGQFAVIFDELSDGQRALIALYSLVHFCVSPDVLLCIDEPDNFIALFEIQPWLTRLIDKADDAGAQILLASHHPELLNYLAADCGIVFNRPDGRNVTVEPFRASDDSTLPPGELVARGWYNE